MPMRLEVLKAAEGREAARMFVKFWDDPEYPHTLKLYHTKEDGWNPSLAINMNNLNHDTVAATMEAIASRLVAAARSLRGPEVEQLDVAAAMLEGL